VTPAPRGGTATRQYGRGRSMVGSPPAVARQLGGRRQPPRVLSMPVSRRWRRTPCGPSPSAGLPPRRARRGGSPRGRPGAAPRPRAALASETTTVSGTGLALRSMAAYSLNSSPGRLTRARSPARRAMISVSMGSPFLRGESSGHCRSLANDQSCWLDATGPAATGPRSSTAARTTLPSASPMRFGCSAPTWMQCRGLMLPAPARANITVMPGCRASTMSFRYPG